MEALLAHSDNPSVQVILKELRQAVSNTIGLISLVLDPEVLILGGALRTLYREGTADLDTQLATWIPSPPSVEVSDFGEQKMHWAIEAWCWNRIVVEGM